MTKPADITADAVALQERDQFRAAGWTKIVAPAKVNLHLAIGARRDDGYHDAVSIMHALMIHDVVYMRRACAAQAAAHSCMLVGMGDVEVPDVAPEDNLAIRAVVALAEAFGLDPQESALEMRIEKNIPAQGGLGGGSTDAAAALVGAAHLWGLDLSDARTAAIVEQTARKLGADVAFFLRGGCSAYTGTGDTFERAITPMKRTVVLVKPDGGVSTAAAYHTFDEDPVVVPYEVAQNAREALCADDLQLFNNLAPAAERLMPELAEIRDWLEDQPGVEGALLCGSGATTFAVCDALAAATRIVAGARQRGLWARTTSFAPIRAQIVATADGSPVTASTSFASEQAVRP